VIVCVTVEDTLNLTEIVNKSSAAAKMGDHMATIDMGACPFSGGGAERAGLQPNICPYQVAS